MVNKNKTHLHMSWTNKYFIFFHKPDQMNCIQCMISMYVQVMVCETGGVIMLCESTCVTGE